MKKRILDIKVTSESSELLQKPFQSLSVWGKHFRVYVSSAICIIV